MEVIIVILAVFIYGLFAPYINYLLSAFVNVVPDTILIFISIAFVVKAILFVIHRGGEG